MWLESNSAGERGADPSVFDVGSDGGGAKRSPLVDPHVWEATRSPFGCCACRHAPWSASTGGGWIVSRFVLVRPGPMGAK